MIQRTPQATSDAARRAAFTLMEMLVVVAIIVVLAGAAVVAVPAYLDSAKRDRAKADCKTLEKILMAYVEFENPNLQDNDWQPLMVAGDNRRALIEQTTITDPWGQPYHFSVSQRSPTGKPKVWTQGPPGGTPISNW